MCGKVYGGRFNTIEEAAEKYNELAIEQHGENSKLNIINTEGTTSEIYFSKINITPNYIRNISTVVEIHEVLRAKIEWKKKHKLTYAEVNRKNLLEFRDKLVEIAIKELGYDDIDDSEESESSSEEDYGVDNDTEDIETSEDK